ncbi:hypothetical protein COOONC_07949 [Cooperia oncophora]
MFLAHASPFGLSESRGDSIPNYVISAALENSVSLKKKRHSKKKSEEKLKEVSSNIPKKTASTAAPGTELNGRTLLEEVQKKVRTGKVPVNEVMGRGYGQAGTLKSQSNATIGRTILQRLVGNNVDPEAIFSAALRQMPQVPGFPSISKFCVNPIWCTCKVIYGHQRGFGRSSI